MTTTKEEGAAVNYDVLVVLLLQPTDARWKIYRRRRDGWDAFVGSRRPSHRPAPYLGFQTSSNQALVFAHASSGVYIGSYPRSFFAASMLNQRLMRSMRTLKGVSLNFLPRT